MAKRYTTCWKCENDIETQRDCNYVKTRDIDISLCPICYVNFKDIAKDFLQIEKRKVNDIAWTLRRALYEVHTKPPLPHAYDFDECKKCSQALKMLKDKRDELLKEIREELKK